MQSNGVVYLTVLVPISYYYELHRVINPSLKYKFTLFYQVNRLCSLNSIYIYDWYSNEVYSKNL